jgi:GDP-L-fucose synthase
VEATAEKRPLYNLAGKRIWVPGHLGMLGSAIMRRLATEDCTILSVDRRDLDLRRQSDVEDWMSGQRPDAIIIAAAKVGGIHANNSLPADFIYDNLLIEANIIHTAWLPGVEKLLFVGSSCIYPKLAPQPMDEDVLLTSPLEATNQPYAVAKIAGIQMCQSYRRQHGCDFIAAMPTNLYGPNDNFDLLSGHVRS